MLIYWLTVGSSIEGAVDFGEFFTAFTNSLTISTLGATLTVICALPLVWAAVRYRSKLTIWLDRIPYLLHAVPGLVIALSLVFFTINYAYSLYQTFAMVIVAYFMLYLPMAQTTLRSSLEQMSSNIEKVGQSLGRSNFLYFPYLSHSSYVTGDCGCLCFSIFKLNERAHRNLITDP